METVNLFLDHPFALLIVMAMGAAIGMFLERAFEKIDRDKRRAYWRGRNAKKNAGNKVVPFAKRDDKRKGGVDLAADQLRLVSRASFSSRSLLNRSEAKVFEALDKAVIARNPGWQVMAQVSLGEFLSSPDKDAYLAVNSKRVDFALMDENACVLHALEYQGSGHHTGTSAAARDAVKKEARPHAAQR